MPPRVGRVMTLAAPTLLAASIVLSAFNETGGNWTALVRPLLIAVAGAAVLTGFAWLAFRNPEPTALAAAVAVLVVLGGRPLLMAVATGAVYAALVQWRRIGRRSIPRPSVVTLAAVVLAIFVTSMVWLPLSGAVALADFESGSAPASRVDQPTMPSIYVIVLDSYPRQDTLEQTFGFDNEPFLAELTRFGFDIYRDASSATVETPLTVLTMLSGRATDLPTNWAAAAREARRRLTGAPGLAELASRGYERVVINSSAVHMEMRGWDVTYQPGQLNNLEATLLSRSPLAPLLTDWVFDQQRQRFDQSLEVLVSLADAGRQRAVLAHFGPPHPPLLFGADGDAANPAGCWPRCDLFDVTPERLGMSRAAFAAAFVDQIRVVNQDVLSAVEQLTRADERAVIIVMSDHGTRSSLEDRGEWNRTLLASRTPGHEAVLADNPTPTDLFRRLIAAYDE